MLTHINLIAAAYFSEGFEVIHRPSYDLQTDER